MGFFLKITRWIKIMDDFMSDTSDTSNDTSDTSNDTFDTICAYPLAINRIRFGPQSTPQEGSYHQSLMEEQHARGSPIQVLMHLIVA